MAILTNVSSSNYGPPASRDSILLNKAPTPLTAAASWANSPPGRIVGIAKLTNPPPNRPIGSVVKE
jgi:hypothetical protein